MTRLRWALVGIGAIVALGVAAFFAVPVLLGFDSEGPPHLVVGDRAEESIALVFGRSDGAQPDSELVALDQESQPTQAVSLETADGTWILAGDSVAGYRVFKDFVGASQFEAVGRTSSVTGDLSIADNTVTDAEFSVNVDSIESDDPRRDAEFRGPILQTQIFTFATFALTSPIDLGDAAETGEAITVEASGELNLKGVTNEVTAALTARLVGDEVQVAGSIDVVFADYGIEPPSTPTIEVHDTGIIEFSLFFEQGTNA